MKRANTKWATCRLAAALALVGSAVALTACGDSSGFQKPPPPTITAAKPLQQDVTVYDTFTGQTTPFDTVEIVARVPGYLEKMHFNEGRFVKKGQLLYTIEQDQYQAQLEQAEADVAAAKADYEAAKTKYELIKEAYDEQAASRKELIEAQAARDQTFAQIAVAQSEVISAQLQLSYTEIRSPIAGQVNQTQIDPGNFVGENATALTTVVRYDPIYIYFTVNQRDLLQYLAAHPKPNRDPEIARPVLIQTANGDTYPQPALIDFAQNVADEQTGTLTLRAIVSNPDQRLYPGVFIRVLAPQKTENAILIPRSAVQRDMQGEYLMIVADLSDNAKQQAATAIEKMKQAAAGTPRAKKIDQLPNPTQTVKRANVKLGEVVGTYQIIESGIKPGDQVVVAGLQKAQPGSPLYVDTKTLELPKDANVTMPKTDKTLADFPTKRAEEPARQSQPVKIPDLNMSPPKDAVKVDPDGSSGNNDADTGNGSGNKNSAGSGANDTQNQNQSQSQNNSNP